ncbi:hypothetical protein M5689_014178 [Euphorbia peplus]|nr:hypothetical protein M5689_014178 [Euphorbia peplus]
MALSPCQHVPRRAISLPSREHPTCVKFEAILNHLKTWQILSISENAPFGAESIQIGLVGVAELYTCVDEILRTQHVQRAILQYQNGKLAEEALDASVALLDTCSILKEMLVIMKENVLTLQSAFRRNGPNYSSMQSNIFGYVNSRKKVQKNVVGCLQRLKELDKRVSCFTLSDSDAADQDLTMLGRVIRESNTIVISIFRSLFVFLSMPPKKKFCLLVSKLGMFKKRSSSFCDQEKGSAKDDFKNLDCSVLNLQELEAENLKGEVKKIKSLLETLNVSVDSLDCELQSMSKCLVQNRVTLLNIFTH